MEDCLFCHIEKSRIIMEEENFYIIRDGFPVTDLHTLIISKRHIQSFFELTDSETDPGVRGDTAQGGSKPAKLETGALIQVPLFIEKGDVLKIDRTEDKYLTRVSE